MRVAVIGSGYVGLVAGACFAEMGNHVFCVDKDLAKIESLKKGIVPIYEPGLDSLIIKNLKEGRLAFTTNLKEALDESLFCFIAVGTPPNEDGSADLQHVLKVAEEIGNLMESYKIIVDKSTVPVGTAEKVEATIRNSLNKRGLNIEFDVVSNPEFLKEGAAIEDFMKPDRVVIGANSKKAADYMTELYAPFMRKHNRIIIMDVKSAEMTKYAANAMLATRISFINEMANLCDVVGADISKVREGIGSDSRIGYSFLFPGVGYGGSCFPKDVKAILNTAKSYNVDLKVIKAVEEANKEQKLVIFNKIKKFYNNDISGKLFAVWGLSFKPNTDDMREAPSIVIINKLLEEGAKINAFDPVAMDEAKKIFNNKINYANYRDEALENADALIIITEWNEFRNPDFDIIKEKLKQPVIFDGRNLYEPQKMVEYGFNYFCIGRYVPNKPKQ